MIDSEFARVALPAIVTASSKQLSVADVRRSELLAEAEDLQAHVMRKEVVLDTLRDRISSQSIVPRAERLKVEHHFKQAQENAAQLEAKLSVARAELTHLQATVGQTVIAERDALQRKREEI